MEILVALSVLLLADQADDVEFLRGHASINSLSVVLPTKSSASYPRSLSLLSRNDPLRPTRGLHRLPYPVPSSLFPPATASVDLSAIDRLPQQALDRNGGGRKEVAI